MTPLQFYQHNIKPNVYKCIKCDQYFESKSQIIRHIKDHEEVNNG